MKNATPVGLSSSSSTHEAASILSRAAGEINGASQPDIATSSYEAANLVSETRAGLRLAYIKWLDIPAGVQWNINGCREEPALPVDPVFGEKIDAVRQACEMLEMQYNAGPTSVLGDFCVRVSVPPFNNSYTVRLHLEVQRVWRNNSACRPAGGY
ncbi:g3840 [Coccomyxa elongata]